MHHQELSTSERPTVIDGLRHLPAREMIALDRRRDTLAKMRAAVASMAATVGLR